MLWNRRRRLSRREAERVLAGEPAGSAHPELGRLLAAASAPPHPNELAGQQEAVAAFERAIALERVPAPVRSRRLVVRSVLVKAVAAAAVLLISGSALAAQTGNLPGEFQQTAHEVWGAPAPRKKPRIAATATASKPRPSPSHTASPRQPDAATPRHLCLAWLESGQKKPDKRLVKAAGGKKRVSAYCGALLGTPAPSKTPKVKKS